MKTNVGNVAAIALNTSKSLNGHLAGLRANEVALMAALRAALVVGEESAEPESFDFDGFIAAKEA
ncbi:type II toxin-antitoxin system ParD family antitoxin [Leifsonia sp. TF02-11]|uniref:type II toxin-antitoxin system ParD family antitoxin n=1 Tax=Leifsonia sp. TF02-11 TaxID=2815212 RepID=UPI0027DD4235|nr:type II toxin-antitoxin system ParD family antitoxin [Leifsonia sp. TF02-11]